MTLKVHFAFFQYPAEHMKNSFKCLQQPAVSCSDQCISQEGSTWTTDREALELKPLQAVKSLPHVSYPAELSVS